MFDNARKKMADIEDMGMTVAWIIECESLSGQNFCVDAGIGLKLPFVFKL